MSVFSNQLGHFRLCLQTNVDNFVGCDSRTFKRRHERALSKHESQVWFFQKLNDSDLSISVELIFEKNVKLTEHGG